MADDEFNPFRELRQMFEGADREQVLQQPLNEAFAFLKASTALFEYDPLLAAKLLRQAADKVELYAERRRDVEMGGHV